MNRTKKLLVFIGFVIIIVFPLSVGLVKCSNVFSDFCLNDNVSRIPSSGEYTAFKFRRDCGATTGFSYQLSLLKKGSELGKESGNVFISDKEFEVEWTGDEELTIKYSKYSNVTKRETNYRTVKITYIEY